MRGLCRTALATMLIACGFEPAEEDSAAELNICTQDSECGENGACDDGMCVAMDVDDPLAVVLEVTPLRAPNGSAPLPIVLDRVIADGTEELELSLPFTTMISGRIRHDGAPIKAEVSFEPQASIPGTAVNAISTTTAAREASDADEVDYTVNLLQDAEYRMVVSPSDPSFPPFRRMVIAESGAEISVDYGELAMRQQTFAFETVPVGRSLQVRAFDAVTGKAVSSASMIVDGEATLRFSPGVTDYRLEIRAEEVYDEGAADNIGGCARSSSTFPVLNVDSTLLEDPQAERIELTLPETPELIRFEGTVELCSDAAEAVTALPITLRSRDVLLSQPIAELQQLEQGPTAATVAGTLFTGTFTATTDADYSTSSKRYMFCVEVLPGEYDVVVTPPAATGCALFAERRLVKAPAQGEAASGTLLQLPEAARLTATLQTMDLSPLVGADVNAVALGRRGSIMLEEGDVSVTSYNRSGQTATDEAGMFTLPVDLGSYDVTIKPPPSSGFAWQIRHDVDIGRRGATFAAIIDMTSPVALRGQLGYGEVARDTLEGAQVRAYAIVETAEGEPRGIAIGKTEADASGSFRLLLPSSIREGW